jgi:hypothetical protein
MDELYDLVLALARVLFINGQATEQTTAAAERLGRGLGLRVKLMQRWGELQLQPAIIAGIAKATLGSQSIVDWERLISNYDLIRDAIEAVFPEFESYNDSIRKPGGFRLPNSAAIRVWNTATQKANFII